MNSKNAMIFAGGLVIGGAAGVLGSMNYFRKKYSDFADKQIAEMEEYYGRADGYTRTEKEEDPEDEVNPTNTGRENGRLSTEERNRIKKQLNQNYNTTTNYAAIYKQRREEAETAAAEEEHPLDQGEPGEEDPDYVEDTAADENTAETAHNEHQTNKGRKPKLISADDAAALPGHIEQKTLFFYAFDEVLVDEEENEIDEPGHLVGDALTKYDFADSNERVIFVMNYDLDTCYEIQKVDAAWSDVN